MANEGENLPIKGEKPDNVVPFRQKPQGEMSSQAKLDEPPNWQRSSFTHCPSPGFDEEESKTDDVELSEEDLKWERERKRRLWEEIAKEDAGWRKRKSSRVDK